jgi:hypothetical protein
MRERGNTGAGTRELTLPARLDGSEELFSAAEGECAEPKGEESAGHGGDDPEAAVIAIGGLGVEAQISAEAEQHPPRHQAGDDIPEQAAVGGFVLHG